MAPLLTPPAADGRLVIPAEAGIQSAHQCSMDSRFRGNDDRKVLLG